LYTRVPTLISFGTPTSFQRGPIGLTVWGCKYRLLLASYWNSTPHFHAFHTVRAKNSGPIIGFSHSYGNASQMFTYHANYNLMIMKENEVISRCEDIMIIIQKFQSIIQASDNHRRHRSMHRKQHCFRQRYSFMAAGICTDCSTLKRYKGEVTKGYECQINETSKSPSVLKSPPQNAWYSA
jgi:hypothetical protein